MRREGAQPRECRHDARSMTGRAAPASPPPPRSARRGETADHFRLMADYAPVMIWLAGPDRNCVYFNRPWLEFTGRPLESELGLGWTAGLHPDDRERFLAQYARAFEARTPFEVESRLRRRDGEYRWLFDKGVPLLHEGKLSGFVGSCADMTDRMQAEQAARKREEDFKTLAENIPDVIARFDRDLRHLYVNRALPESMRGHSSEAISRAFESGLEQHFRFELEAMGQRRHFVGRVIPERGVQGRLEAVLCIIHDDTVRALEDERRAQLLARERFARANAESATLARDQFLAIVSHELRSPLNGIKSWTHVLENQLRNAEPSVRRAVAGIMIGVEHQVRLIDDLLDATRAMSGNLGLAKQPMQLLPVLADAVESLRALAAEKGLRIATEYGIGECEIHGDPDRVRQVFVNLLTNAVKFTPAGGSIWVTARIEGAMARVDVRDNGAGVPPEFLPYLCHPFRQADQGSSSRGQEGLGPGLGPVQQLPQPHRAHPPLRRPGLAPGPALSLAFP